MIRTSKKLFFHNLFNKCDIFACKNLTFALTQAAKIFAFQSGGSLACSLGTARAFSNKSFCDNDRCVPAGENRGKVVSIAFPAACSSGGMVKSEFYSCASNLWLTQSLEIIVTLAAMTRPNCVCMFYLFSIHFLALPLAVALLHMAWVHQTMQASQEDTMPHRRTSFFFLKKRILISNIAFISKFRVEIKIWGILNVRLNT
jgi:hypothetical protein